MPVETHEPPRKERLLSDYKLHYASSTYPLLAFMYAVLAGGEHTIYCDHTAAFANHYLFDRYPGGLPPHAQEFIAQLAKLEEASGRDRDGNRVQVVHAGPEDYEVFLRCLKVELNAVNAPSPAW